MAFTCKYCGTETNAAIIVDDGTICPHCCIFNYDRCQECRGLTARTRLQRGLCKKCRKEGACETH